MIQRTIQVVVSTSGDISIDAVGFKGADCEKATRFLEEALGETKSRVKKPEYHTRAAALRQQRLGA
jgi:Protein of unknown function (DUF2997)